MPNELKIILYFIGIVAIGISVGVLATEPEPAYSFITIGVGLIVYPLWERFFVE